MTEHCHVEPVQKTASAEELAELTEIWLAIFGMGCPTCARRVTNSLLSLSGVVEALVDHLAGMAKVTYNPTITAIPALLEAVERAGNDGRHTYWAAQIC